jgi:hypothetical protein
MSIQDFFNTVVVSIQHIGTIYFLLLVVLDIVLWRIHPALGTIGAILLIAYLLGMF